MFARLTALVGSGSALPFEVQAQQPSAWGNWTHFKGVLKADGSPISIFRISAPSTNDAKLQAARNGIKRLRTLRHPNILAFKDTAEVEERGETAIYLATEAVAPLASTLRLLELDGAQKDHYLCMGLHQIVAAVSFLNNDCKLIHGNVCEEAIVVTDALDWKLHAFDLTTEHDALSTGGGYGASLPLAAASWAVAPQYKPGELARSEWSALADSPSWAVDAWGLGCLMQEVFSGAALSRMEELRNTSSIAKNVLPYYQKLLASQPARRLNPAKFAESGVLRNKLVETMAFLENLTLKDSAEKDAFFKRLPSSLPNIPQPVSQRKLLPLLATALEFGGAPPVALTTLLSIGDTLSEEERSAKVIPILSKLFASSDRGIRRGLLENISSFGSGLPAGLVEDQIYPNIQAGFADSNPYLRELTLKSMAVLGSKLSVKTLNQSLLKHLAKLQVDEEPAIRANTTVLLGNLAPFLSDATCKKVLLNAFARAAKDPFPPARAAGVKAIMATSKHHGPEEAATRVLPMLGPLCIDPVGEVRGTALQCLEHFMNVLQANHKELERKAVGDPSGQQPSASSSSGAAGGGLLTGFGWSVSSLVNKGSVGDLSAPVTATAPTITTTTITGAAAPANSRVYNDNDNVGGAAHQRDSGTRPTSSASSSKDWSAFDVGGGGPQNQNPALVGVGMDDKAADNGWEDAEDDGWEDDLEDLAAEQAAREKLSRATVSHGTRPAVPSPAKKKLGAARNHPSGGAGGAGGATVAVSGGVSSAATLSRGDGIGSQRGSVQGRAGSVGGAGKRMGGGMKLGGNKLGATKMNLDEADFDNW